MTSVFRIPLYIALIYSVVRSGFPHKLIQPRMTEGRAELRVTPRSIGEKPSEPLKMWVIREL